jgi:hypothetical protein
MSCGVRINPSDVFDGDFAEEVRGLANQQPSSRQIKHSVSEYWDLVDSGSMGEEHFTRESDECKANHYFDICSNCQKPSMIFIRLSDVKLISVGDMRPANGFEGIPSTEE